jgi:hypothetical protein
MLMLYIIKQSIYYFLKLRRKKIEQCQNHFNLQGGLIMKSRRNFLKSAMSALGFGMALFSPKLVLAAKSIAAKEKDHHTGPTRSGITWRRNIFCQIVHGDLKAAIERCAIETDCTIFYGSKGHPDIHACPAFVMVVDRHVVGFDMWREYVEYSDINGDDIPCFIIDNISDLPLPKKKYVYQFDMNNETTIPIIIKTITEMKTEMDRRLPALFKNS